jgi:hypothetical protein
MLERPNKIYSLSLIETTLGHGLSFHDKKCAHAWVFVHFSRSERNILSPIHRQKHDKKDLISMNTLGKGLSVN